MSTRKHFKYTYYCLGCHKEFRTNKFYEYGFICRKCAKKGVKLTVKCCDCGKDVKISWYTYKMKGDKTLWRCNECNAKYQSKLGKEYWNNKTDEEKKLHSEKSKEQWKDLTPEQKIEKQKYMTEGHAKYFSNEEKVKEFGNKVSSSLLKYFENESEEDYIRRAEIQSKVWNSKPEEERKEHMMAAHEGYRLWVKNRSEEARLEQNEKISVAQKNMWDNKEYDRFVEGMKKKVDTCNNKSNEDKYKEIVSQPEFQFVDILNKEKLTYKIHYYNITIDPKLHELFPYNPYRQTDLVSPFHEWDFLIETKLHNIYIDIDGSKHDPKSYNNIKMNSYNTIFDDSQRPYMRDDLQAYVILAYENKIDDYTPVVRLDKPEKILFKTFMEILHLYNGDRPGKNNIIDILIKEKELKNKNDK